MVKPWIYLVISVFSEIAWATSLKSTEGFTRLQPSIINVIALLCNLYFLSGALKELPVSLAYSIWTGLGIIGVTFCGIFLYGERFGWTQAFCTFLIVLGAIGLKSRAPE